MELSQPVVCDALHIVAQNTQQLPVSNPTVATNSFGGFS
jgi:hypothetical protein